MSLISARELSFEFGGQRILSELSCSIEHNSRIGLIGANGSGKTTLIRLFLGELQPSAGTINRASSLKIAYLPQNAKVQSGVALIDFVKASRPDILALQAQIQALSAQLDKDHLSKTEEQLHTAVERFTSLGGYEWENEVKHVLMSLNFQPDVWDTDVGLLSGGEQTRLCLAAILLKPHNLLIMDEPTNHLDIAMIRWLESYLLKQDRPYLLVSHDRSFLDACVTSIFHIRSGKLSITKGNYSSFAQADEIARQTAQRTYERQKKEYEETMDFVRRNIAGQKTKQAQSRLKRLEKMDLQPAPRQEKQLRLKVQAQSRSGNDLYILQDVSFGIAGKQLAQNIDLYAGYQDRICIIGPNGCGKTTFLHLLMGDHTDYQGQLKIGASLDIGYFDQRRREKQALSGRAHPQQTQSPDHGRAYQPPGYQRCGCPPGSATRL
jgi:ATP-binding cassette subfamily F protein 3